MSSFLIREYFGLKSVYNDCIIMYQVGEFFEILDKDAAIVADLLSLTLTKRSDFDMCGVPKAHAGRYAARLAINCHKTVLYAQVAGDGDAVKRDVVRIFTPGTLMEDEYLPESKPAYLACVYNSALAWADVSTGVMMYGTFDDVNEQLTLIDPAEIIALSPINFERANITRKNALGTGEYLSKLFRDEPKNMSDEEKEACDAILCYIYYTQCPSDNSPEFCLRMESPVRVESGGNMILDSYTIANLEIFASGKSLYGLMCGYAATAIGKRMLRRMLSVPCIDLEVINDRLDVVEQLYNDAGLRKELYGILKTAGDFERAVVRIASNRGVPSDLVTIKKAMGACVQIHKVARSLKVDLSNFDRAEIIYKSLDRVNEYGGDNVVKPESDPVLHEMYNIIRDGKRIVDTMAARYRGFYDASSLCIGKNATLGYYVEVAAKDIPKIVDGGDLFLRRKLAACSRYSTKELSEFERKILHAEANFKAVELDIINELFTRLVPLRSTILSYAAILAKIDVAVALSMLAVSHKYARPVIDNGNELVIKGGKHPVLFDQFGEKCADNDTDMRDNRNFKIITAPNMSGKSVFLKQNALIVLMAQIGSFVPAIYARIGVADRLFCRIGADDDMCSGHSTFMREMIETSLIVNFATSKSLVIIDELGRGTSTKDGVAIALSVIEYLHNVTRCRAVVATHYHELARMTCKLERVSFCTFEVYERDGKVIFPYKLKSGVAVSSYGVLVAEMAGLRAEVIDRARELLNEPD